MSDCPQCGRRIFEEEKGCEFCGSIKEKGSGESIRHATNQKSSLDYDFPTEIEQTGGFPKKEKSEQTLVANGLQKLTNGDVMGFVLKSLYGDTLMESIAKVQDRSKKKQNIERMEEELQKEPKIAMVETVSPEEEKIFPSVLKIIVILLVVGMAILIPKMSVVMGIAFGKLLKKSPHTSYQDFGVVLIRISIIICSVFLLLMLFFALQNGVFLS